MSIILYLKFIQYFINQALYYPYTIYSGGKRMEYMEWFSKRLTELRLEKGVSARDMSLSLGQSESYINKIENRRTMPSMAGFFYICDYFEIEPQDFFNYKLASPQKSPQLMQEFGRLTPTQADHVLQIVRDILEK